LHDSASGDHGALGRKPTESWPGIGSTAVQEEMLDIAETGRWLVSRGLAAASCWAASGLRAAWAASMILIATVVDRVKAAIGSLARNQRASRSRGFVAHGGLPRGGGGPGRHLRVRAEADLARGDAALSSTR